MVTFLSDDLSPNEWSRRRNLQASGADPNGGIDAGAPIYRLHDGLPNDVWQKVRAQQVSGQAPVAPSATRFGGQRPGVGPLLGLVSQAEGTQADGYDTMFNNPGGRRSPPGAKRPTEMTIDEVVQTAPDRVRLTGGSAVGKYQFMPKTLTELKKRMGLTGAEVMTPELQDAMGEALIYGRGFDRYQLGVLSAAGLQKELANEWSSLASDANGYSAYDKHGHSVKGGTPRTDLVRARMQTPDIQAAIKRAMASEGVLDRQLDGGYGPPL